MVIPIFDGEIDAYWWVLCTEKYFKQWNTPEEKKMVVAALAMKGQALTWWLQWYPHHSWINWDKFTSIFLWWFKPEWRPILPLPDEEDDSNNKQQQLQQDNRINDQLEAVEEEISDFNQLSSLHDVNALDFPFSPNNSPTQSQIQNNTPDLFPPAKEDKNVIQVDVHKFFSPLLVIQPLLLSAPTPNPRGFFNQIVGGQPGGCIVSEPFFDVTPTTAENFCALYTGEKGVRRSKKPLNFNGYTFHRVIPKFICQGGDFIARNRNRGESRNASKFVDENFIKKHTGHGILSMANAGPGTNESQFFICNANTEWFDGKHVVFVLLFDPGGNPKLKESWSSDRVLTPPPKPPEQNFSDVSSFSLDFHRTLTVLLIPFQYSVIVTKINSYSTLLDHKIFLSKFSEPLKESTLVYLLKTTHVNCSPSDCLFSCMDTSQLFNKLTTIDKNSDAIALRHISLFNLCNSNNFPLISSTLQSLNCRLDFTDIILSNSLSSQPPNNNHRAILSVSISLCFPQFVDLLHDLPFQLAIMLYTVYVLQEKLVLNDEQVHAINCITTTTYDHIFPLDLYSEIGNVETTQWQLDDMSNMILDCPTLFVVYVALDRKVLAYMFVSKCWFVAMKIACEDVEHMQLTCDFVYCVLLKKRDFTCSCSILFNQLCLIHHCLRNTHLFRWFFKYNIQGDLHCMWGAFGNYYALQTENIRGSVDIFLKSVGYLDCVVRHVLPQLPAELKRNLPVELAEGVIRALCLHALGHGVDIQLGMAIDNTKATLAVKRRIACEMVKYWQHAQDNITNLLLVNGWGEKHCLYVKWKYIESKAAAYYYHDLIIDEGNTEKSHEMDVSALQAAGKYFKESKKLCEALNATNPLSRWFSKYNIQGELYCMWGAFGSCKQQWEFGKHLDLSKATTWLSFKQWDPGKFNQLVLFQQKPSYLTQQVKN